MGLIFSPDYRELVLIKKNRPDRLKGFYSGVGGKIENNEKPMEAMIRECEEECGLKINKWKYPLIMSYPGYEIHLFYSTLKNYKEAITKTDEEVQIFSTHLVLEEKYKISKLVVPLINRAITLRDFSITAKIVYKDVE